MEWEEYAEIIKDTVNRHVSLLLQKIRTQDLEIERLNTKIRWFEANTNLSALPQRSTSPTFTHKEQIVPQLEAKTPDATHKRAHIRSPSSTPKQLHFDPSAVEQHQIQPSHAQTIEIQNDVNLPPDTHAGTMEIPEDQENKFIEHPTGLTTPVTPVNTHQNHPMITPVTISPHPNHAPDTDSSVVGATPANYTDNNNSDSDGRRRRRRRRRRSHSPEDEAPVKNESAPKATAGVGGGGSVSGPSGATSSATSTAVPPDSALFYEEQGEKASMFQPPPPAQTQQHEIRKNNQELEEHLQQRADGKYDKPRKTAGNDGSPDDGAWGGLFSKVDDQRNRKKTKKNMEAKQIQVNEKLVKMEKKQSLHGGPIKEEPKKDKAQPSEQVSAFPDSPEHTPPRSPNRHSPQHSDTDTPPKQSMKRTPSLNAQRRDKEKEREKENDKKNIVQRNGGTETTVKEKSELESNSHKLKSTRRTERDKSERNTDRLHQESKLFLGHPQVDKGGLSIDTIPVQQNTLQESLHDASLFEMDLAKERAQARAREKEEGDQEHKAGTQKAALGKFQEAIGHFTKALDLLKEDADPVLFSARCTCYAKINHFDKALEDANKVCTLKPEWSKGYDLRGILHCRLQENGKAVKEFQKALERAENEKIKAKIKSNLSIAEKKAQGQRSRSKPRHESTSKGGNGKRIDEESPKNKDESASRRKRDRSEKSPQASKKQKIRQDVPDEKKEHVEPVEDKGHEPGIPIITIEGIQDLIGIDAFYDAKTFAEKNGIKKLEYLNNTSLKAHCVSPKSSNKYTCEITFTGPKVTDHKCTCHQVPGGKGIPCHHIGALLLACKWEQEKNRKGSNPKIASMYITPSMVLSTEDKQREAAIRQRILGYSSALLGKELILNGQNKGGRKEVLTDRCIWGALRGALPKCPRCKTGHLKYVGGVYYCSVSSSSGESRCPSIGVESIKRTPWRHAEP